MIKITADFDGLVSQLDNMQKKQIPFAASQALNEVAQKSVKALRVQATKALDRPTPFTLNGFRMMRSSKANLSAVVYIAPIQNAYMRFQVEGGVRRDKEQGRTIVPVEGAIKLNKYGNIPGRKTGIAGKSNRFVGTHRGVKGIWARGRVGKKGQFINSNRKSKSLRLVAAFNDSVVYKSKLPFYKIVNGLVSNNMDKIMKKKLIAALRTARR